MSSVAQPAQQSVTLADEPRRRDELRVVPVLFSVGDPENIGPREGRVIPFDTALLIGRKQPEDTSGTAWVVKDQLVSGRHCLIIKEGDVFKIRDLGSKNGTVVDGVAVKEAARLRDGAIIFVGSQIAVFRLINQAEIEAIHDELRGPLGPVPTASPTFAAICRTLRKLADSDCEILLTGETGVGKEVYARAVHDVSGRKGPFVPVNCAALPRELVESELFGYVRGAHSQARENKRGLFEEAEGGTLFLDEVGEMSPELQTKLLRFLQDREITPLGATRSRRLDIRILAATSRTSAPTSSSGGLRGDLAARLGAEPIRLPPLRHRIEDLGVLAAHFLREYSCKFTPQAFQALALHNWPGNVRELQKVMESAELLAREDDATISPDHLPSAIASGPSRLKSSPGGTPGRPPPPDANQLEALLQRFHGNVQRVARELGRTPPLIYRWCKRFKLDPDAYRPKEE